MPYIVRLAVCVVLATVLSMIYNGFQAADGFALSFNTITALSFVVTGLVCALVMVIGLGSSETTPQRSTPSSQNGGASRESGTVKWFNPGKGFGFITRENGEEIFVHFRSLDKSSRRLAAGLQVEFDINHSEKGPEAIDVVVVN